MCHVCAYLATDMISVYDASLMVPEITNRDHAEVLANMIRDHETGGSRLINYLCSLRRTLLSKEEAESQSYTRSEAQTESLPDSPAESDRSSNISFDPLDESPEEALWYT